MTYCGFCDEAALSRKISQGLFLKIGKSFLSIVYKVLKSKVIFYYVPSLFQRGRLSFRMGDFTIIVTKSSVRTSGHLLSVKEEHLLVF